MMAEGVELCLLHNRPELVEQAAALLNTEWPRSLPARSDIARMWIT